LVVAERRLDLVLSPAPSDHEAQSRPPQEQVRHPRGPSRFAMFDMFDDEVRPTALIGLNLFIAVSMTIAATKEAAVVPTPPTSVLVSPSLRASQGEAVSKLARLQFSPSLRAL
jgi:hypothetical protein